MTDYIITETSQIIEVVSEGPQGSAGARGSLWYTGAGAPGAGLGEVSDLYLDTETGSIYQKTGSGWGSPLFTVQGPAGPAGEDAVSYSKTVFSAAEISLAGGPSGVTYPGGGVVGQLLTFNDVARVAGGSGLITHGSLVLVGNPLADLSLDLVLLNAPVSLTEMFPPPSLDINTWVATISFRPESVNTAMNSGCIYEADNFTARAFKAVDGETELYGYLLAVGDNEITGSLSIRPRLELQQD